MKAKLKTLAISALLALQSVPSMAQDAGWNFDATLYLFTPETKTGIGGREGTLSFSDALDNLDMAFMGAFAASNGRWSVLADYMLTDLSFGNTTPGPAFSGLNTSLKTQILNGYVAYRFFEDSNVSVDFAGGFRWFDTRTNLTLLPGLAPGNTRSVQENWVDPVVGIRTTFRMSEKWSGTVFADYGGFSSDSETWQVLLLANYAFNDRWIGRIGYRQISVDHDVNGTAFSFDQSGPMIGITYRF